MHTHQPCFRALSDPTRREILTLLSTGDMTIAQLTNHFQMTRAAVKKHLTVLCDGGLISSHSVGRERINHLEPLGFAPVHSWLGFFDIFWETRLDGLASAIETQTTKVTTDD